MAGRKLAVNTTALDEDGRMVTFPAGTVVSDKVAKGITNPKAWEQAEPEATEPKAIADMTKAELEAEVAARNASRPEAEALDVGKGTKAELLAALEADNAAGQG